MYQGNIIINEAKKNCSLDVIGGESAFAIAQSA